MMINTNTLAYIYIGLTKNKMERKGPTNSVNPWKEKKITHIYLI